MRRPGSLPLVALALCACAATAGEGEDVHPSAHGGAAGATSASGAGTSAAGSATSPAGQAGETAAGAAGAAAAGAPGAAGAASGAAGSPLVDPALLCQTHAQARCSSLERCFGDHLRSTHGSHDECLAAERAACSAVRALDGVPPADEAAVACAEAVAASPCAAVVTTYASGTGNQACPTLSGTLDDGQRCVASAQCRSGRCSATAGSCGACAPRGNLGEGCSLDSDCASPLVCAPQQRCVEPAVDGEPCSHTRPCARALTCNGHYCIPRAFIGDACDPGLAYLSGCAPLGLCDADTRTCVPFVIETAPGGPCGLVADGKLAVCAAGLVCRLNDASSYRCAEAPARGEPCSGTPSYSLPCATIDLVCIDGLCRSATPDAAACTP